MTKKNLIKELAMTTGLEQKKIKKVLDGLEELVYVKVLEGEKVALCGFLNFSLNEIPATERRNVHTNEMFLAPPTKKLKVKVSNSFNKMLNVE